MAQQHKISRNNTKVFQEDGKTIVQLWGTRVVEVAPSFIRLFTGGYETATTKTRMNQASNQMGLGYYVYQKRGQWFVTMTGPDDTSHIPFIHGEAILRR